MTYEEICNYSFNGKIYCNCIFEWNKKLKEMGFRWDKSVKLWYIPKTLFTQKIFEETTQVRFCNRTTSGPMYYYYVFFQTRRDMINRIQTMSAKPKPKQDLASKYAKEKAEMGKREQIKAEKELLITNNNDKNTSPPKQAESFGAGFYIEDD